MCFYGVTAQLTVKAEIKSSSVEHIEGLITEGSIDKMADVQETKFLRLFDLINVHY
jgi:hypothetical protein